MTTPAALLERYLRQRRELGELELVMEQAVDIVSLVQPPLPKTAERGSNESRVEARNDRPVRSADAEGVAGPAAGALRQQTSAPADRGTAARPTVRSAPRETAVIPPAEEVGPILPASHPLTVLNAAACGCTACGLASSRTRVVFGEGNPQARLVVVGEAPGADEDRTGRPFVGKAGNLLNTLLQSIGFPRESVYICNVLKCRPPGNRNPLPDEVEACAHFLAGQLEAISPKAILAVGTFPAQALLRTTDPIGRLRGTVHSFDGTPLVPTYHPAALLRNPGWIRPVWEDLQRLRQVIDAA